MLTTDKKPVKSTTEMGHKRSVSAKDSKPTKFNQKYVSINIHLGCVNAATKSLLNYTIMNHFVCETIYKTKYNSNNKSCNECTNKQAKLKEQYKMR